MGGFFGVASKKRCVSDLFFGVDYHSHLGPRRGGLAVYGENGFKDLFTILKMHLSVQNLKMKLTVLMDV